jgi:hypothetical protein
MGDGKEFQSRSQLQQRSQLGMCELAHCHTGSERLGSVCPFFYARFYDADVSNRLHSTYCLWYGLKIVNHDYPLTIPKNEAIIFPADGTLLNFFVGVSQGASTACSGFFYLDRSDGPMFHPE